MTTETYVFLHLFLSDSATICKLCRTLVSLNEIGTSAAQHSARLMRLSPPTLVQASPLSELILNTVCTRVLQTTFWLDGCGFLNYFWYFHWFSKVSLLVFPRFSQICSNHFFGLRLVEHGLQKALASHPATLRCDLPLFSGRWGLHASQPRLSCRDCD